MIIKSDIVLLSKSCVFVCLRCFLPSLFTSINPHSWVGPHDSNLHPTKVGDGDSFLHYPFNYRVLSPSSPHTPLLPPTSWYGSPLPSLLSLLLLTLCLFCTLSHGPTPLHLFLCHSLYPFLFSPYLLAPSLFLPFSLPSFSASLRDSLAEYIFHE